MKRAFYMLDELRDIVQGKPRPEITEVAGRYLEGLPLGGDAPTGQPAAQRLVDDLAEGPTGPARLRFELGGHIIVQSESRSHGLMLSPRHHDVNAAARPAEHETTP